MDNSKEIRWVTGLKGVCAISVVLLHMLISFYYDSIMGVETISRLNIYNFISYTPINIFFNGNFSVYIFWIVSAFLIAVSWYTYHDIRDMQRKIFNKYFRILLPIIVCSVVVFIMIQLGMYFNEEAGEIVGYSFLTNERDFASMTIKNLLEDLLINDFFRGQVDILPPLWTLHIDFYGSVLSVLFLLLFGDKKKKGWMHFFFLPILIWRHLVVYACFLIGNMLAQYKIYYNKKNDHMGIVCLIAGIFLGGYPACYVPNTGIYRFVYAGFVENYNEIFDSVEGTNALYIVAATLILYGLINSSILQKIYSNRLFYFWGKNSFYIYLIHIPVLFSLNAFLFVTFYNKIRQYNIAVLMSCVLSIFVIFILSYIFRIFCEKKLNPISKKVVDRLMEDNIEITL